MAWTSTICGEPDAWEIRHPDGRSIFIAFNDGTDHMPVRVRWMCDALNDLDEAIRTASLVIDPDTLKLVKP